MSTLTEFFQGSETRLGVFYPSGYIIAIFRDPDAAGRAARKLHFAGFDESNAIATDGAALLDLDRDEASPGAFLMQAVSRFMATEQLYMDHDLERARRGAGFVAVHCPDDQLKAAAWEILKAEDPIDARYYAASGIEHLAGDPKTD
jgi:hypothetical protein